MSRFAVGLLAVVLPLSAAAAPEIYTFDPYHTFAHFEATHLDFSHLRGRFDKSTGTFAIDRAAKTASVELTVQTASVTTGMSERGPYKISRDDLLRSPDYFNAVEFPTMTFKASNVKFTGDFPTRIEGILTLLGVSKPLTLNVINAKCGTNFFKKEMCGGNAEAALKRSEFGMKTYLPTVIGDDIKLWIEFEGYKN